MNHYICFKSGQYLAGPRTPTEVRKLRVVSRHMGGSLELEVVR
jgi:hypothetical protein